MADQTPERADMVLCNHRRLRLHGVVMRMATVLDLRITGNAGEIPGVLLSLHGEGAAQFMLLTAEGARHLAGQLLSRADQADQAGAAIVARHLSREARS